MSYIINDYVTSAEEYMTAFALGSEVHDLLADPDNPALLSKAQQYTEDFASVKGIFEGLYVATPDTHVLTHTSHDAIGITTRSGDSLVQFQDTILARRELTNLGIMKSPGTGSMILSAFLLGITSRKLLKPFHADHNKHLHLLNRKFS